MKLCHISPAKNDASIGKKGLLTKKSQGRLRAVWFVEQDKVEWALLHSCGRHKVRPEALKVHVVDVPDGTLKRSGRPGLWYSLEDLPPALILESYGERAWLELFTPQGDTEDELIERMQLAEAEANVARG